MPETPRRPKHTATQTPKMPPAPPAGNTELSDEELGRVSGGIGLENSIKFIKSNEPKLPSAKSALIPNLNETLP